MRGGGGERDQGAIKKPSHSGYQLQTDSECRILVFSISVIRMKVILGTVTTLTIVSIVSLVNGE